MIHTNSVILSPLSCWGQLKFWILEPSRDYFYGRLDNVRILAYFEFAINSKQFFISGVNYPQFMIMPLNVLLSPH